MSLLNWFDNRTLFVSQCLLTAVFAIVFLCMHKVYPQLRGVRTTALAFLAGVPCMLFLVLRGGIPQVISATTAALLAIVTYLGMYAGVAQFTGTRNRWKELAAVGAVAVALVYYFSVVRPVMGLRVLAMGLAVTVMRGMTAWVLLGLAEEKGRVEWVLRRTMGTRLLLGSFVALMVVTGLERTVSRALGGGIDKELSPVHGTGTSTLALNLAYMAIFGVCFLVMAIQELIARSQEELERDGLTGLLNRRGGEQRLALELQRSGRSGDRLCVALVDVDRFKTINDTLGHAEGDEALRTVASAMRRRLRETDVLARYGGDEFLVVMPHTSLDATPMVAERLGLEISRLKMLGDGRRITISIGLTEASPDDDLAELVARADEALYSAKRAGRACWRMLAPDRAFTGLPGAELTEAAGDSPIGTGKYLN